MVLLEALVPAVLGGLDLIPIIGWVGVAAMVIVVGAVVFLALGLGTQSSQGESAEPTPTDDDAHTTGTEEPSDTATESRSH